MAIRYDAEIYEKLRHDPRFATKAIKLWQEYQAKLEALRDEYWNELQRLKEEFKE